MRGRAGWRWWHGFRYAASAFWVLCGVAELAGGTIPGWITGTGGLGAGATLAVLTARAGARHRRSGCDDPRGLLLALARERAGVEGAWLNRDEHLAFTVTAAGRGPLRRWLVARADEDQARDYEALLPGGRLAMTADSFTVMAAAPEVLREPVGAVVRAGDDLEPAIVEEPRGSRRQRVAAIWRRLQAERSGHLYASAEEIRELAAQFQAAELVTPAN